MAAIDPNGTTANPQDRWIWLAPDWSDYAEDGPKAPKPGWTHVKVRESRYNDGRVVTQVLDENGKIVSDENGPRPALASSTDTKQSEAYARQAPKPLPPGASPTQRQPDGTINSYNPETGVYDTPTGASAATTQRQEWRSEGTPDGQGGYDNSRPVMAEYVNGKRTGATRAPTGDELKDWNVAQQISRNGGKTDAEIAAEKKAADDKANVDADNRRADQTASQSAATAAAASRRADSAEARAVAEANKVGSKVEDLTIGGKHYTRITKTSADGKTTSIENYGPDGNQIPTLPDDKQPGKVIEIGGESYWAAPNADPSQSPTLTRLDPAGNKQPTDNGPQFTDGMSPSQFLTARRQWLMEQRRAGVSQKDIDAIWERDKDIATSKQNEANTRATQENQRLSSATTGIGQAMTAAAEINKYLPVGSDLGGRAFEAYLGIHRGQAQRMGAYGESGGAGRLTVPAAPTAPDPSSQVAAIPGAPTGNAVGAVANGVTATNAAAINPTGANVQAATDATMDGANAAMGAIGVEPQTQSSGVIFRPPPAVPGSENVVQNAATVAAIPESPYDFAQRIANTAPWRLSEQDHQRAQEMGLGNAFWSTGRGVAA